MITKLDSTKDSQEEKWAAVLHLPRCECGAILIEGKKGTFVYCPVCRYIETKMN